MLYRIVLVLKLVSVLAYGGGLVAAFVASAPEERRRAVHKVASPALLAIWVTGYGLASMLRISLMELWLLGSLVLSLASQIALVRAVAKPERSRADFWAATVPLVLVVMLMVFRPTWDLLRSR
ncbi:hypothetical protein AKJ09_07260 [Labilithrix luteola]|uniref:Uncharacterized protein n=1 Tax=Labilithrix luteola TaxID=1391654 RepID=A0A0K1Q4K7_9BACT|nr:hypothetical protein [Labilithrix luteola]AKV00597.1 hypothetical protein AKJ09_07260 [Labilithrix luteola]